MPQQSHPTPLQPEGKTCPSVSHSAASEAHPFVIQTSEQQQTNSDAGVGNGGQDLSDEQRETAILAAGLEVEGHMRLRLDAQLRYRESNCLTDQADADRHLRNAKEAASYMALLILQRSPEQERRMLMVQRERMLREPGAEMGLPFRQSDLDRAAMQRGRG